MEIAFVLPYNEIINFPVSTVQGHKGRLFLVIKVVAMQGRFHFMKAIQWKK
jgi:purine-nucleoside phosphorylase